MKGSSYTDEIRGTQCAFKAGMTYSSTATTSTSDNAAVASWIHRIEAEYREMPGLSLTRPQIQRMWGLSGDVCDVLLATLQARQVLRLNKRGGYVAIRN